MGTTGNQHVRSLKTSWGLIPGSPLLLINNAPPETGHGTIGRCRTNQSRSKGNLEWCPEISILVCRLSIPRRWFGHQRWSVVPHWELLPNARCAGEPWPRNMLISAVVDVVGATPAAIDRSFHSTH